MKLYNTLTRKKESVESIQSDRISVYTCGPTVYDYAHIGNFRSFVFADILVRTLKYVGFNVLYVMNITDVGHLVSDADSGEDKLQKGAKREGKTAWEVASFFEDAFLTDSKKLNLSTPNHRPKPTKLISEQLDMIGELDKKGYTYTISDGVYFDTSKVNDYGKLTGQNRDELLSGVRVKKNIEKKNPTDFALWKFSLKDKGKRDMEWDSPYGTGFPGWHIECSVMAKKYLGDQIDIHTGGFDHIPIHHTNEIAQSESVTGKVPFSRFWFHIQFMNIDNKKMSKSKENYYTLKDLEKKGFNPLSLRYFYLTSHYRSHANFTLDGLKSAKNSLDELRNQVRNIVIKGEKESGITLSKQAREYKELFDRAISDDINTPQTLSVLWNMMKSSISIGEKYKLILLFDQVLGFDFKFIKEDDRKLKDIPKKIETLLERRNALRKKGEYEQADKVREEIEKLGYKVKDTSASSSLVNKSGTR